MTSLRDIKCPHCVTQQLTADAQCERRTDTAYKINSFVHSTFIIYINMSVYLSLVYISNAQFCISGHRAAMQRKGEWFVWSLNKGNPATFLVLNYCVLHACATYLVFPVDLCGAFWICSISKSAAIWAVNLVLLLLRVRKKETIHHILLPIKRHWNAERSSHLKACLTIQ